MGGVESTVQEVVKVTESSIRTVGSVAESTVRATVDAVESTLESVVGIAESTISSIPRIITSIPETMAQVMFQRPHGAVQFSEAAQSYAGKTPEELRREAQEELGIDSVNCFNFGFAGNTGTGKSSLINAIRGLNDNDENAAKVDEIECTSQIKKYSHPINLQMVLWDIPGGSTPTNTAATYFMDKKLYAFDTIVIIGAAGFTELDIEIAKAAKLFNVPIVFVRSKSDIDIDSRSHRLKKPRNEVKFDVKGDIIANMRAQLPADLMDRQIFVISSRTYGGTNMGFEPNDYALDETQFLQYISAQAKNRI